MFPKMLVKDARGEEGVLEEGTAKPRVLDGNVHLLALKGRRGFSFETCAERSPRTACRSARGCDLYIHNDSHPLNLLEN